LVGHSGAAEAPRPPRTVPWRPSSAADLFLFFWEGQGTVLLSRAPPKMHTVSSSPKALHTRPATMFAEVQHLQALYNGYLSGDHVMTAGGYGTHRSMSGHTGGYGVASL